MRMKGVRNTGRLGSKEKGEGMATSTEKRKGGKYLDGKLYSGQFHKKNVLSYCSTVLGGRVGHSCS